MMTNLKEKIGQLFMLGYKGATPPSSFLDFIDDNNIGGVILFKDNCPSQLELKSNIEQLVSRVRTKPWIAVDQEGGRVIRVTGAPAEMASAWEYATKLGLEKFEEDYRRCLLLLDSLGINMNLAPVADIFLNDKNSCLESRCFGSTTEQVIPFATKAVELSKECGLISCAKHFPGLGDSEIDPHYQTAEADYDFSTWSQREKFVYEEVIRAGVHLIMTTHLHLPKFDDAIVTGSEKIINELLIQALSYDGLIITDDLLMRGADTLGDVGERTVAAFNAGHDLLLFGQDLDKAVKAYQYFEKACVDGKITEQRLNSSVNKVAGMKYLLNKSVII